MGNIILSLSDKKYFQKEVFMHILSIIAYILVIIGAINWGLVGFFQFDLVAKIFGDLSVISRIIYALVGLSGLFLLLTYRDIYIDI
jgi:uncharacterized membrane protein YuzA (DUF378 family)